VNPAYPPVVAGVLLSGGLGAAASRWTSLSPAALISGAVAVLTVMMIHAPARRGSPYCSMARYAGWFLGGEGLARFSLTAACVALLVGVGCFLSAERAAGRAPESAGFFAAAGAGAPLLILAVAYLRHVPFQTRPEIGIAALGLALVFAVMTERLIGARPDDAKAPAPAFYAAGAVLALSFAASVGLATRYIPLALSLGAAGDRLGQRQATRRRIALAGGALRRPLLRGTVLGPSLTPEEIGTPADRERADPEFRPCRLSRSLPRARSYAAARTDLRQLCSRRSGWHLRRFSLCWRSGTWPMPDGSMPARPDLASRAR
jgi:hypothetical protein